MRFVIAGLVGILIIPSFGTASPPVARELRDIDVAVFTCTPNPSHFMIASPDDLAKVFARLAPYCGAADFSQRKAAFLHSLERAHVRWGEDVVVIASDWYGTGMAKPGLVFSGPTDGILTATISWKVPPPPVTPDTATCRFVFAVRRAALREVLVVGQNSGSVAFRLTP